MKIGYLESSLIYILIINLTIMFGVIEKDSQGKIICEICGKSFHKLGSHIRMTHKILTSKYRKNFGLNRRCRLMSDESIEIARLRNKENFDLVVTNNLVYKGKDTRFINGSKGRPKSKLRQQELIRLKKSNL